MSELEDIKNTLEAIKGDISNLTSIVNTIKGDISDLSGVINSIKAHDAWAIVVDEDVDESILLPLADLKQQKKLVVRDLRNGTKFVSCT